MRNALLLVLLFMLPRAGLAEEQKLRSATAAEFVGYWKIVLIPNEVHGSPVKNEQMGYSGPCQFLVLRADGNWFSVNITNMAGDEQSKRQCPTKRAEVDTSLLGQQQSRYRWSIFPNLSGMFVQSDTAPQSPQAKSMLLWKADLVLEDVPSLGMRKGDMLLQVARQTAGGQFAPVWPMILRPIPE